MGHLLHDPPVDLLNARLTVDDNVVKAAGNQGDDLLQIGIYLAVAARRLRPADGQKGDIFPLRQGIHQAVPGLSQHLNGGGGVALLRAVDKGLADVVHSGADLHPKRRRQTHSRVGINGQYFFIRVFLR